MRKESQVCLFFVAAFSNIEKCFMNGGDKLMSRSVF